MAKRMHWTEKVLKLKGDRPLAAIERAASWKTNHLSNAINDKSMPQADRAIRLAQALRVPAEWLFDESSGMEDLHLAPLDVSDPLILPTVRLVVADALKAAAQAIAESVQQAAGTDESRKHHLPR